LFCIAFWYIIAQILILSVKYNMQMWMWVGMGIDHYCWIYTPRHPTLQRHLTIFQWTTKQWPQINIFWHIEGGAFSVIFSVLQITNNLTARWLCSIGRLVVTYILQ
jgi:hypothetical protein